MPRASSVASATYYDNPSAQGTPGAGADSDDDEQQTVDLDDPLAQQELEAFGAGAVEEPLPAPPADPNAVKAAAAAAEAAAAGAQQAQAGTTAAGAGEKRTLAASGPLARAKRPKNVKFSPAKVGKPLARRAAPGVTHADLMLPNNDFCDACGGKGHFLCCEGGCLRSFHFQCLEPPLEIDEVPDESWYCKSCRAAVNPPPKPPRSYFTDLIYKVETENPKQFSLTNELKGFFKHVAAGTSGEFIDAMEHRPPSKITGRAIGQEDRDGYRLKDKNGKSIICYNCDGAAQPQQQRRIISCDFCDQHWHLDCLDPPMTGMPPPTRKWMCPLHADHLMIKKRAVKTIQTINVDRCDEPNSGDIIILPSREKVVNEEVEEIIVNRIRYQVPEQHVILDFWGRVSEGPRSRRKPKIRKNRSPRKPAASGYESGNSSPLTDLTSSEDESDSDSRAVTPAAALPPPAPTALDNLALLAEVRYIDQFSSSSGSPVASTSTPAAPAAASTAAPASAPNGANDKGKARAFPPSAAAAASSHPRPSLSPAPASAAKSAELVVESKDDLQALMRVRKMIQAEKGKEGEGGKGGDPARRAAMLGFLEGEPILPSLGFINSTAAPWTRPWEQGGKPAVPSAPSKPAPLAAIAQPSPTAAAPSSDLTPIPSSRPSPAPSPAVPSDVTAPAPAASRPALAPQESPLPFSLPASKPVAAPVATNGAAARAAAAGGEDRMDVDGANGEV
ncbi:hypothetical protein JCM8547_006288 [Rhodosporidiobolus lusitaniae]